MISKKKEKKTNSQKLHRVIEESRLEKNNTLIVLGGLLSISSIGLLIFVISEKIFHLS